MLEMFSFIAKVKAQSGTLPNITDITPRASHFTDINDVVQAIGGVVVDAAGILALVALIYSGIMYMTAGSDATKAEKAKKNLMWAIIGIFVVFLAFIIIEWINNIATI